jgi:Sel1 repeat
MMRYLLLCIALLAGLGAPAAHADQLDDDLQTVWEALWDQRGTPRRISRWKPGSEPIRYRVFGEDADRHKKDIRRALDATTTPTGLTYTDVSDASNADVLAQLQFEIFKEIPSHPTTACLVNPIDFDGWDFVKVSVQMQTLEVWHCAHHEVMHAMGITGHPSGKTVLSYFGARQDRLSDLDRVMLQAWYSAEMSSGASLFDALPVLANYVAKAWGAGRDTHEADMRVKQFLTSTVQDMENFAQGKGGVPTIVRRSGAASEEYIKDARSEIAYMLGVEYAYGGIVAISDTTAVQWYERAALAGHEAGQFSTGRAYFFGKGVAQDKAKGYRLLLKAANGQNKFIKNKLTEIEKELPVVELEQLRQAAKD